MKKKFVNVALLAVLACGASGMLTSCNNDDWKDPVNTLETSTADIKSTLSQIDKQISELDSKIAENKSAAAAAAKAADDAMAAAKAANDEAVKAAEAAKAASALAEQAAAQAKQEAAENLKKAYEELSTLISANKDAIALNKAAIEGNADAIKANTGKIEGNTKAIEDILAKLNLCATSESVNAQYKELADKLAAAGVATDGKIEELSKTIAGLQTALNAVEGQYTALIGEKTDALKAAIEAEMGTLEQSLAAKIAAGDNNLQNQINEIDRQLRALEIPANIKEFTALQASVETQERALADYKAANETKLGELKNELGGKIEENLGKINEITDSLDVVKATIAANQTALTQQINALSQAQNSNVQTLMQGINAVNSTLSTKIETLETTLKNDISTKVNTLDTRLNTLTLGSLRGLVFIPEVYVGGIESALSYSMYFKPMKTVDGTQATKVYTLNEGTFTVNNAPAWNKIVDNQADQQEITPATVISYHMNPTSAVIDDFKKLSIVSNDAEILSRASKANITLDATYNENAGFAIADGVLSVAIKGEAPIFASGSKKMPVFALQAKVPGAVDEEGKEEINIVTSDYAMFAQMNIEPTRIQYNMDTYTSADYYGNNLRDFIDVQTSQNLANALRNSTATTVAWNSSVDLLPLIEVAYNDIQRNEESVWTSVEDWGKFGLDLSFQLVDYTIGDNRISESSWASIDAKTGVLTPCVKGDPTVQNRDELGHMPLVYMTLKQGNKLVLDGFIRVKIVPDQDYFQTAVVTFPNIDFTCEGTTVDQKEEFNIVNMMAAATQMTNSVIVSTYKPVVYPVTDREHLGAFRQFKKEGEIFSEVEDAWGMIYAQTAGSLNEDPENQIGDYTFAWVLETLDEQKIYEQPNHSGTTYVCFESGNESYPDIFIPVNITVNAKSVYTIGDKFEARWFRDMSTALLNVMPPYDGQQVNPTTNTINTVLNQLWQGGVPKFTWASGAPKPANGVLAPAGYKYYFTAANNVEKDGIKYSVANKQNPCLLDFQKKVASNANMGSHALLVTEANSEYNNTVLMANGKELATLDPITGQITLADNETARELLNKFPSMSLNANEDPLDRMAAKLQAIVGVVPYSSCDIAYALTNPDFKAIFLRPINVDPTKVYDFTDAEANGDPVNIYGMLKFTDWRNVNFISAEWLYGYYDVKSVVPQLDKMTTNAGTVESDPTKFVVDPTVCAAFELSQPVSTVTYNTADITPNGSSAIKTQLMTDFGTITYNNTKLNVKKFTVKIPFEVTYGLGKFTVEVTCNIDATMPNQNN